MIWLKRVAPIFLILAGWAFFHFYSDNSEIKKTDDEEKYALLTAQVWVASAKYRNEPEKYLAYRDSLLTASNLDNKKALDFIDKYEKRADELVNFASLVSQFTDSLINIEDSLSKIEQSDSTALK